MPTFPDRDTILTREEAVNAILTSIAMEETALSHILNAEGEKIQYVLAQKCHNLCEVVTVNESVASLVEKITDLQFLLKAKLQVVRDFLPPQVRDICEPHDCCEPPDCREPPPPCKCKRCC